MITYMLWSMQKYEYKDCYDIEDYCISIFFTLFCGLITPILVVGDILFSPIEILAYVLAKRKQRSFDKCQKKNY